MALFGFGKKAPAKNTVKTPWGYVPLFTTEAALPRDLNQLRGMSYYYRNTEPNDQNAFLIDQKICELDTEGVYTEARRRLGICYFRGTQVPRDVKKGSELFLFWVDSALENGSYSGLRSAIVDYFSWGFTDCEHLLKVLNRRIEREHKENADPLGLWTYRFIFPLWQYSYVKNYITLKGTHMPYFMEWLQANTKTDYSYWITKIFARDEGVYMERDAADAGNIFAINDQLEWYRRAHGDSARQRRSYAERIAELEKHQQAIFAPLKKEAAAHDHRQYAEQKARMDEKIKSCEPFFKGSQVCLPEEYPFYKGEGSLYHTMSKACESYRWLAQNSFANEKGNALLAEYNRHMKELTRRTNEMAEQNYLPGVFLQILAAGSMLIYGLDVPGEEQILKKYEMLVEKGYADAIRMKTECRPEEIPLARRLRCNPQVTEDYRKELEDLCRKAYQEEDWRHAIQYLWKVRQEGGTDLSALPRNTIVAQATKLAGRCLKQGEYQKCEDLAWYAAELGEARACHIMAVLCNDHKQGRHDFGEAKRYLEKALSNQSDSCFVLDGKFTAIIQDGLRTVQDNIDKSAHAPLFGSYDD